MPILVVAEKPSVARDLAQALGASARGDGCLHGNGYLVTWAIGHLVRLTHPDEIRPEWRAWRRDQLPMLPSAWPLAVIDDTKHQFEVIAGLMRDRDITEVVCATDAGREGELIFRLIAEAARCDKPVKRLWISSLTPQAIRAGFARLRDARDYDALAAAARGRAQADWLVGMNLSRLYTLQQGDTLSVGRVQTPTLALLVEREQEIRSFVACDYLEVVATFGDEQAFYRGRWFDPQVVDVSERKRLPPDGARANEIVERVRRVGRGNIASRKDETKRLAPPLLYDLTELQRHANRLFGFSADRTLKIAQSLYESKKLLSYPRTDSRHLSTDVAATLPDIVKVIGPDYEGLLADGTGRVPLTRRFVDDSKVSDHHAIIPTTTTTSRGLLSDEERKVYDLVCRRLLSAWHGDHVWSSTTLLTVVTSERARDHFHTIGTAVLEVGWKVLDLQSRQGRAPRSGDDEADSEDQSLPGDLYVGADRPVLAIDGQAKKTRPPKPHTDATLLSAMEGAGKLLDDKELSAAMKECGLGTPATRAAMIETLLTREYAFREGKGLRASDKGIRLIDVVHADVASPAMTGAWEARLRQIERGEGSLVAFMRDIERYVTDVVGQTPPSANSSPDSALGATPARARPQGTLTDLLASVFGHDAFREHQEEVCRAVSEGQDALLVMPTGAGKSLCYQLPGLARGGTTLVISPLIALIEDQVSKLSGMGLAAERIHSGRSRSESRDVCKRYLAGALDYLYVAPERLGVPGFGELLARRKPTLVAIDEAHCISQWGHDFRPDYRMLGERLPMLRPAPVIAVTATATPRVQADIAEQLRLTGERRFIHGFRRTNLAIEVVEVPKPQRPQVVCELLADSRRRPAIVYAPTRDSAAELATALSAFMPAAAYHAGMSAAARERVQNSFIAGTTEVVVATVAFGMGIDKANIRTVAHLALPQTLEGYYQEIGRAGRDGAPSRVVLLHSYVDRKTHEYFREASYPAPSLLADVFRCLDDRGESRESLKRRVRLNEDDFDRALNQLWVHGGARVDADDIVRTGNPNWRASYEAQLAHRLEQEQQIAGFAAGRGCRMVHLVRHFGDQEDAGAPCGLCDACAPESCVVQKSRAPTKEEVERMRHLVMLVTQRPRTAVGALYRDHFAEGGLSRQDFEALLAGLTRARVLTLHDDVFEKDGKRISFQRVCLSDSSLALQTVRIPAAFEKPTRQKKKDGRKRRRAESEASGSSVPALETPLSLALREWRLSEARRSKIPAFRILSDRTLHALVAARPHSEATLLAVNGIGPSLLKKYGPSILSVIASTPAWPH